MYPINSRVEAEFDEERTEKRTSMCARKRGS